MSRLLIPRRPPQDPCVDRRGFLRGAATAGASAATVMVREASAIAAAAQTERVLGYELVQVPAAASFRFAASLANHQGAGESSAIRAPYWMSRTLVTNAQYAEFVRHAGSAYRPSYWTASTYPSGREDHPVLFVSGVHAKAFCAWLNSRTDAWRFRLPTEAEWEWAARGPHDLTFPWGEQADVAYSAGRLSTRLNDNTLCAAAYLAAHGSETATYVTGSALAGKQATIASILSIANDGQVSGWINEQNQTGFVFTDIFQKLQSRGGYTTSVGQYRAGQSAYGAFDVSGNAWEWTSSLITAQNGGEKGDRVAAIRGGSWYAQTNSCTAIYRGEGRAFDGAYNSVGFRVFARHR